jgi:hypothetical protein
MQAGARLDQHEVVFESVDVDVEDSHAGPKPAVWMAALNEDVEDGAIQRDPLCPASSFLAFHKAQNFTDSVDIYSLASGNELKMESPIQRFQRLRSELAQLKDDLDVLSERDPQSIWTALQTETGKLLNQHKELETHKAWTGRPSLESVLTTTSASSTSSSISTPSVKTEELRSLEARLQSLESALGVHSNIQALTQNESTALPALPLLQRLERKLNLLDAPALEALRSKANLLKWELEAMSGGSKTKAQSQETQVKLLEAVRKLEGMGNQLQRVQGVADDLPTLVLRLKTLETLHWTAASTQTRLSAIEAGLSGATQMLEENGRLLSEMKEGLKSNLDTLHQNVLVVEQKLSAMPCK